MRIALASDVHLEFGYWEPVNPENADVLILSGDILVASKIKDNNTFTDFLKQCKDNYKEVVYVAGNHEHYHGNFKENFSILSEESSRVGIHYLEKSHVEIGEYLFIGGTIWTDLNKGDPYTLYDVSRYMNDYRLIYNLDSLLRPEDTIEEHKNTLAYFKAVLSANRNKKAIVVGHHAPSKLSVKPRYEKDATINGAYNSDLSEFILDNQNIKLWTHGHTHDCFEYMIGETKVVCNPRGYVGYERPSNETSPYFAKVIELD
jgi:Icc-related predicted phosphoesterase